MKKVILLSLILGFFFIQKSNAQNPVGFPDGITVGTPTVTIPAGSSYKMAVAGGIITEKIRVATNGTTFWADFVFDKSYKLRSLNEVAKYIKLNKHLPDVPSTAEVTQQGIDLANTQAILLQKIEELTLYVIEQNKKIERLNKKVRQLSKN
ncbi:hypothetical protein LV89_00633 [Arcicella aurantiaca]|uniref:Uncharacterized protein n=1 Tax=Arcicella aurantiaca TaxID=591202 RepID=A0A316EJP7_9BACT|nr:hypothetical protein [Arcicella aurantiaca]PWK29079.1 hypothetical protein LV89_00633 [Arcicella aurantiaca]